MATLYRTSPPSHFAGPGRGQPDGFRHVDTEHLLLGLIRENEDAGAEVLQKMGVSLAQVRQEIEAKVQAGEDPGTTEPKLTPKAKRVVELSADEARRMGHNYIGTEHMLLALMRERDGLAAAVLRKLGPILRLAHRREPEWARPNPRLPGGSASCSRARPNEPDQISGPADCRARNGFLPREFIINPACETPFRAGYCKTERQRPLLSQDRGERFRPLPRPIVSAKIPQLISAGAGAVTARF